MSETNAYILGTEKDELLRLGLQHEIWSSEAHRGWELAGFGAGMKLLDLGCGPGYCTRELAYMVGRDGKVIGVDRSKAYIDYLVNDAALHDLNIELQNCDFMDADLDSETLDGIYHRWALAWVPNPTEILLKMKESLKPGGVIVSQEYYDWSVFQTEPSLPGLAKGIGKAYQTFVDAEGDINIGRKLPAIYEQIGMKLISVRTMSKLAYNGTFTWQWPKSFLQIYIPKLVASGYLSTLEGEEATRELHQLENIAGSSILCPQMLEVIAVKK